MSSSSSQNRQSNQQLKKTKTQKSIQILDFLINKLGIRLKKSKFCKHQGSCSSSLFVNSVKIGIISYGIKSGAKILTSISSLVKKPNYLKKIMLDKSNIKFGMCLGAFVAIFRILICSARRFVQKEDLQKYLFMIAGFIGGILASLFLSKQERQALGLFLFARALDVFYQSLVKKQYIPENKMFYPLLYSTAMVITGYCFINEPGSLSKQTYKFYKNFVNQSLEQMKIRRILTERKNLQFLEKGLEPSLSSIFYPKLKPII